MKRDFSLLDGRQFDLLVCGGGIYGAWSAYDAALRGLRVALVEQGDWASATSSASSKLIHGGLRYLESLDIKLVKKSLAERQMLLSVAPHRVWPLRFGVPVYAHSRVGTLQLKTGLSFYDLLADSPDPDMAHHHYDANAFAGRFPFLSGDGLKGGFTYADAQTDDARLVLELVAGAQAAGALCINYCKLTGWLEADVHDNFRIPDASHANSPPPAPLAVSEENIEAQHECHGQACGAILEDQLNHGQARVFARQIVNATGPWSMASEAGRDWCRLDKGVHLVMPALPADEALLLTARTDGRVFFMIPWYGMTLLGTTDADYSGDLEHIVVEHREIAYLLKEANHYLKTSWTEKDVVGRFAGLRVMKRSHEAQLSAVSRDWELKTARNGVYYSIGGKLTSAREDAACIVDTVCAKLGVDASCATRFRSFPWAPESDYARWFVAAGMQAMRLGIDQESARWLIRRHGRRVGELFCMVEQDISLAQRIVPALPFIHADLLYCAANEMVIHLDDLLRRRMPLLILTNLDEGAIRHLAGKVAAVLGWDDATLNQEISGCVASPGR